MIHCGYKGKDMVRKNTQVLKQFSIGTKGPKIVVKKSPTHLNNTTSLKLVDIK